MLTDVAYVLMSIGQPFQALPPLCTYMAEVLSGDRGNELCLSRYLLFPIMDML